MNPPQKSTQAMIKIIFLSYRALFHPHNGIRLLLFFNVFAVE
jgi:hypothetical protein